MKSKLGEVLREEREKLGITQRELARVLAVDRAMISRYETGAAQMTHDLL